MRSVFGQHLRCSNASTLAAAARVLSADTLRILTEALYQTELRCDNPNTLKYGQILSSLPNDSTGLDAKLMALSPWRKGPFTVLDIDIDSEWQSGMKWDRIVGALPTLSHKIVLDVGCGNGYYMHRMMEKNPKFVLGIDPSWLCFSQFSAIRRYLSDLPIFMAPIGVECTEGIKSSFDVIFCMGVMYHRRSPLDLLRQLRTLLKSKGTLILETLVIPGDDPVALCPYPTYAKMPNVYFLPTLPCLMQWVRQTGFLAAEVISDGRTTTDEQRRTRWSSEVDSLAQFLTADQTQTIEGFPVPRRVAIKCECPPS